VTAILRRRARPAIAVLVLGLAVAAAPFVRVHGWDWSIGTDSTYVGVYWPHFDFYAEHAR
jgi:hypothetical protein